MEIQNRKKKKKLFQKQTFSLQNNAADYQDKKSRKYVNLHLYVQIT